MNIINNIEIESNNSIIFRNNNAFLRFYESGNGDIYLSAITNNNDYDFYLSDELLNFNIVNNIVDSLSEIKNNRQINLHQRKECKFNLFEDGIFNWKSDEWNIEKSFNTMQIKQCNTGIILSINKNIEDKENVYWGTIAFNTNRGHNKLVSCVFSRLLRKICNNNTKNK